MSIRMDDEMENTGWVIGPNGGIMTARHVISSCSAVGWQPIETAPKDGTTILGYWCNGEQHTGSTDGSDWFPAWEHDGESWVLPTHWMPIPAPPKG